MAQLDRKKRAEVRQLLEDHETIIDALRNVRKSSWFAAIVLTNDTDNEVNDVRLDLGFAKRVLAERKVWIEAELKKLGIETAP